MPGKKRQRPDETGLLTSSVLKRAEQVLSPRRKRVRVDGTYAGPSTSTGIAYCSSSDDLFSSSMSSGSLDLSDEEFQRLFGDDFAEEIKRINAQVAQSQGSAAVDSNDNKSMIVACGSEQLNPEEDEGYNVAQPEMMGGAGDADEDDGIPMHKYVVCSSSVLAAIDRSGFQNEFLMMTTVLKRMLIKQNCGICQVASKLLELLTSIVCTTNGSLDRMGVLKSLETSVNENLGKQTQALTEAGEGEGWGADKTAETHQHEGCCQINSKSSIIQKMLKGLQGASSTLTASAESADTRAPAGAGGGGAGESSDCLPLAVHIFNKVFAFIFGTK